MTRRCLGLDVGGANLKAALAREEADGDGPARLLRSRVRPFPLWREPGRLEAELVSLAEELTEGEGPPDRVALTMTGELADAYPDRATGVRRILDAVAAVAGDADLRVLTTDGAWAEPERVRDAPHTAAAANWTATARYLSRHHRDVLLADMGSTTTDLVPVVGGEPAARGGTDYKRMRAGELVYTGLLRTPVAAMVRRVEVAGREVELATETFAVAADVHLWLGSLLPEEYACEPPDGGPISREASGRRLARMLCSDPEELDRRAIDAVAEAAAAAQARRVVRAVERQRREAGGPFPRDACPTGVGAGLMASLLRRAGLEPVDPPPALAPHHAAAATAACCALLGLEGDDGGPEGDEG